MKHQLYGHVIVRTKKENPASDRLCECAHLGISGIDGDVIIPGAVRDKIGGFRRNEIGSPSHALIMVQKATIVAF